MFYKMSFTSGVIAACLLMCIGTRAATSAAETGCVSCHNGIEDIRQPGSEMMRKIRTLGLKTGDPDGCTICHGGNPTKKTKEAAHAGGFYADP